VELDELADDAVPPEHLGDPEHQVGGGGPFGQPPGELEPHHLGEQHVDRLAHHGRFRLDTADPPADDTEAVDHRGVRVGADERVRIERPLVVPHDLGEVLEVDLVDDPGGGRDHPEVAERRLAPLEELVALPVALELTLGVDLQRHPRVEGVDLDRVVDDQVGGHQRVDLRRRRRVTGHADDGGPHRRQVDHRGDAGEVLEHHPARGEGDLGLLDLGGVVLGEGGDIAVGDGVPIMVAQHRLEQHLDGVGQGGHVADVVEGVQPVDDALPQRGVDGGAGLEGVVGHRVNLALSLLPPLHQSYRPTPPGPAGRPRATLPPWSRTADLAADQDDAGDA
jgi:hypothetical protein